MPEANETAVIALCGGCGYPTLGPQLVRLLPTDDDRSDSRVDDLQN